MKSSVVSINPVNSGEIGFVVAHAAGGAEDTDGFKVVNLGALNDPTLVGELDFLGFNGCCFCQR